MPQSDPSKTEQATPKRRNKAREKGNVPKSQEVSKTFVVLGGLIALHFYIGYMAEDLLELFRWFMIESPTLDTDPQAIYTLFLDLTERLAVICLPIMLVLAFVAFLTVRLQVGPLWTTKVFEPKFEKFLNIPQGLQRMFLSMNTFVRLGKNILTASAIAVAVYVVLRQEWDQLLPLFHQTPANVAVFMLSAGSKMVIYAALPMVVISVADIFYTRWEYEENLKMTKDEVKDERKQAEGDPKIRNQQKQKMMKVMMQRMLADVPKADVVITNPTHFAVALKYDTTEAPAPVCLAKGVDHLAQKIKQIARENNVPIRENKPLARALYKSVEVGETIPEELYKAVAAILAQIFRQKHKIPF